ncbi:MAG: group 1 glycosyl transferase [Actinobacteria bacterium]|nr:MAG: group 1 glycosyl transferase [Actinomycetota bacterium]
MTRVAMITGTYRPERDGVVHYVLRLREALAQRGVVSSVVLTTKDAAREARDGEVRGVVDGWGPADLPALVRGVKEAVREGAEVVHVQHAAGTYGFKRAVFFLPPLLRAAGVRAPLVTTVHEYAWWEWEPPGVPPALVEAIKTWGQRRGFWDREDGFLLTESDALITTNAPAENAIKERLPHLAGRLRRIPLVANVDVVPVNGEQARREVRSRFGWSPDAEVVAYFGFLHPVKGIENLLKAHVRLLKTRPRARLLLIGGAESLALPGEAASSYRDELRTLIGGLGLTDTVAMTGYVPEGEASRLLSGSDVGVLPFNQGVTLKSGTLLALLGHGLPTVVTRSDPPEPDLSSGEISRLVERRDVPGIAGAISGLLADSVERERLAEKGRSYVRNLSWPLVAERHGEIYERVLRDREKGKRASWRP